MNKRLKSIIIFGVLATLSWAFDSQTDFLSDQKRFERVRTAIREKQQTVENILKDFDLELDNFNLLLVAYKDIDSLEIYAKHMNGNAYQKIHAYHICAKSGHPGPKRREGDGQVPEGFYHIDRFNPASNYYLSLGLNYPNLSDLRKTTFENPGGDIFIHGGCITIGCLPMTNDKIKEIYLLAMHARNNGQKKIPVYIFPFKMSNQNMSVYKEKHINDQNLIDFWLNIKLGYDKFFEEKKELDILYTENGDYTYLP